MPPKKEICLHFQRGSCKFGNRCRNLHTTPQQSKPNSFGFGTQIGTSFQHTNQQQPPNPFGFGAQNNSGGNNFGSKPNQFKLSENQWRRNNTTNTPASRQSDQKPPAGDHTCTDSASCQRVLVDDHGNEEPQWKLTCYGHRRNGPCDIVGDISFDELRALAYDDAKNGKSLPFIAERERSLLNSKLAEFQNLLQKPYTVSSVAAPSSQNPFAGGSSTAPSTQNPFGGGSSTAPSTQNPFGGGSSTAPIMNNGFSTPASSFSQLKGSLNTGSAAGPNYSFGQSSAFANPSQTPSLMNYSPFNTSGVFGSQPLHQHTQSSFSFGSANPSNNSTSAHKNPFSTFANSSQTGNASDKLFNFTLDGSNSTASAFGQSSMSIQPIDTKLKQNTSADDSIWSKAEWKWNAGEIPEEAPPQDICIH